MVSTANKRSGCLSLLLFLFLSLALSVDTAADSSVPLITVTRSFRAEDVSAVKQQAFRDWLSASGVLTAPREKSISTVFGPAKLFWNSEVKDLPGGVEGATMRGFALARSAAEKCALLDYITPTMPWQVAFVSGVKGDRWNTILSSAAGHSAWAGPPANIMVDISRLRSKERKSEILDAVLVHEIGHVLEFHLMGRGFAHRERWHGEGFATWFASLVGAPAEKDFEAKRQFSNTWRPYRFGASKIDYLMSYSLLAVLANDEKKLFAVYRRMDEENLGFARAVHQETGWDESQWLEAAALNLNLSK